MQSPPAGGGSGAIFTTTPDGSVENANVQYQDKREVYLNGTRGGVHSGAPSALVASNAEARIGARFDGLYGMNGAVYDVRVYSRALTATEIGALAKR